LKREHGSILLTVNKYGGMELMKVSELYDYLLTVDENLDITIEDVSVCNWITTGDKRIFLSTNFENAQDGEPLEQYILNVQFL
jgi:rRNA maturation protein Rpf1